jgi:hypothetical protein
MGAGSSEEHVRFDLEQPPHPLYSKPYLLLLLLLLLVLLLLLLLFYALQHPPVYTLGAGSSEEHVKFDLHHPPHPLYRTERGGEVTYHGPGQVRGTFGLLATLDSSPLAVVDTGSAVVKAFIALLLVHQHCHFQHLNLPLSPL